jgi:large subunit ribosomal protein L22
MKRVRPAPMGRAFRVVKRTTHLTVEVTEKPQVIKAVGTADETAARPKRAQQAPKKKAAAKKTQPAKA